MPKEQELKWADFMALKPVRNPTEPSTDLFETYGADLEFVKAVFETEPKRVWTLLDTEGEAIVSSGMWFVNRIAYMVTELPCPIDGDFINVEVE